MEIVVFSEYYDNGKPYKIEIGRDFSEVVKGFEHIIDSVKKTRTNFIGCVSFDMDIRYGLEDTTNLKRFMIFLKTHIFSAHIGYYKIYLTSEKNMVMTDLLCFFQKTSKLDLSDSKNLLITYGSLIDFISWARKNAQQDYLLEFYVKPFRIRVCCLVPIFYRKNDGLLFNFVVKEEGVNKKFKVLNNENDFFEDYGYLFV